jgi:hypothetical protein
MLILPYCILCMNGCRYSFYIGYRFFTFFRAAVTICPRSAAIGHAKRDAMSGARSGRETQSAKRGARRAARDSYEMKRAERGAQARTRCGSGKQQSAKRDAMSGARSGRAEHIKNVSRDSYHLPRIVAIGHVNKPRKTARLFLWRLTCTVSKHLEKSLRS